MARTASDSNPELIQAISQTTRGPGHTSSPEMRWSIEGLALTSMARPPLSLERPPAPGGDATGGEPAPARLFDGLLEAHFEHLVHAFNSRTTLLDSGEATGVELAVLEGQFLARTDALRWLGPEVVHELGERLASAEEAGTAFAAALPLLSLEGLDILEAVKIAAERSTPETGIGLVEALRFSPHPRLPTLLQALVGSDMPAFLRAPMSGLLVQRGCWDASHARTALAAEEPDVLAAAARAVLCLGRVDLLDALELLLTRELEAPADIEVMVAAAVLGSSTALSRARARLTHDTEPSATLIRMLAACGTREDVELLRMLARKQGPESEVALWTLARLGAPEAMDWLREMTEGEAKSEAAAEGLRWLEGPESRPPRSGRVARGAAWTAQVPVSVLLDSARSSAEREWACWELTARTGLHVPFDTHWPWARQQQAAREWEVVVRKALPRLAVGNWLYQGKPTSKRHGT